MGAPTLTSKEQRKAFLNVNVTPEATKGKIDRYDYNF